MSVSVLGLQHMLGHGILYETILCPAVHLWRNEALCHSKDRVLDREHGSDDRLREYEHSILGLPIAPTSYRDCFQACPRTGLGTYLHFSISA